MNPSSKLTIVGGGIVAAMEAYYAYLEHRQENNPLRITINEKTKFLLIPLLSILLLV